MRRDIKGFVLHARERRTEAVWSCGVAHCELAGWFGLEGSRVYGAWYKATCCAREEVHAECRLQILIPKLE